MSDEQNQQTDQSEQSDPGQTLVRVPVLEREAQPVKRRKRDTRENPRQQPPHAVIFHDDDLNSIEYVVILIQKVFGYEIEKAVEHTLEVHTKGRSIVWSGMKEHAELKAEQVTSCGGDPMSSKAGPLRVTVEPLPE